MIIVDTTVLAYAVGEEHPLRKPCRRLLTAHADGRVELATTVEVFQEFTHIRARRRSRRDAVQSTRSYLKSIIPLQTSPEELELGLALFEQHEQLGAFDAVLAAVALERRVDALVSADRAYGSVTGLRWVDPSSPAMAELTEASPDPPLRGDG